MAIASPMTLIDAATGAANSAVFTIGGPNGIPYPCVITSTANFGSGEYAKVQRTIDGGSNFVDEVEGGSTVQIDEDNTVIKINGPTVIRVAKSSTSASIGVVLFDKRLV